MYVSLNWDGVSFIPHKNDLDYETDPPTAAISALHSLMQWNCIVQNFFWNIKGANFSAIIM